MMETKELKRIAAQCRLNALRMIRASGHGHMGGAFSCMDIVTVLYFSEMKVDPQNPKMKGRDRFILSAGHKCLAQYAVLAEKGYFPKEVLDTYGSLKTQIPGHPDMHKLPGVEANTGALGHGLAIADGMAMGLRLDGSDARVYVVMGDGELAEGSNWEAAAAAAHHKLDNLCVFVDFNGLQISGRVQDVMNFTPIEEKFRTFGWHVLVIDGNDMGQILGALDEAARTKGKPTAIVAHTIKAKGIPFMEDLAASHFWSPDEEELQKAESSIREQAGLREEKEDDRKL